MSILDEIVRNKKHEVAKAKEKIPLEDLKRNAGKKNNAFKSALVKKENIHIIAEIKKASPSAGTIRENFDPVSLARDYEKGGASAISVLTDRKYFGGSMHVLEEVVRIVKLPVLRKDFIFDEYQVYESSACGASAILLIARILSADELKKLKGLADDLGLDSLVEAHSEEDMEKAVSAGAEIIGINNRDLATLSTDIGVTEKLISKVTEGTVVVSESGIRTREDIKRLKKAGVNCFLVGENILKSGDAAGKIRELKKD